MTPDATVAELNVREAVANLSYQAGEPGMLDEVDGLDESDEEVANGDAFPEEGEA